MGKCEYNDSKEYCTKDICCFECKEKCKYEIDRCYIAEKWIKMKYKGYPSICKFYFLDSRK